MSNTKRTFHRLTMLRPIQQKNEVLNANEQILRPRGRRSSEYLQLL
ncbi:uncharacterized protein ARMOST_16138 [Armillaria ostoyae]|uniref:Uncharacterized protein n=1 Tax=Armillaria ostoyae TaxID=47428 RepID=A0A284RVE0_ARMOS|nr:uncharacterized protein ARMOST_16138 [Armillaria ostoyae]